MMTHLRLRVLVPILALAVVGALGAPASAASLDELMRASGLKYMGPTEKGLYGVLYEGENTSTVEVRIVTMGEGVFQNAMIFGRVVSVPSADKWDTAVFPWLLERPSELIRGHFILLDEGKLVLYTDNVPLAGLDGPSLRKYIALAAAIIDDAYPKVKGYVK